MRAVSVVAEIDLAVSEDRDVRVGNVDHSVRSNLRVDRAEVYLVDFDELHLLTRQVKPAPFLLVM